MHFLVMSPSSCDFTKTDIDKLKYQQYCNSHDPWVLDGRTSILARLMYNDLIHIPHVEFCLLFPR